MRKGTRGFRKPTQAAKEVAQERKYPRPVKCLDIAWHDEEKKQVALRYSFRVVIGEKMVDFYDSRLNRTRYKAGDEDLDFTAGLVTVKLEHLDEEGNTLGVHFLSHVKQHMADLRNSDFRGGKISYLQRQANSPNALLPAYNPNNGTAILDEWQAMADSPDAYWLDGKKPSIKEEQKRQDEWLENRKQAALQRAGLAQTDSQKEPDAVYEGEFNVDDI